MAIFYAVHFAIKFAIECYEIGKTHLLYVKTPYTQIEPDVVDSAVRLVWELERFEYTIPFHSQPEKCKVDSYILDLRKEGCPMALLLAKRASQQIKQNSLEIYIADKSSMQDMVRYFEKQGFSVQSRNNQQYFTVTITKESTFSDARNG